MRKEIYYFSGSGNSLCVARDIACKIGAELKPVAALAGKTAIDTDADIIGFVFPSYDFKPPKLIGDFLKKFEKLNSKYIFAVCTFGIAPSKIIMAFDSMVESAGGKLSSGFVVKMPHNGIGSALVTRAQKEIMFKNWRAKLETVSRHILEEKKGVFEKSGTLPGLMSSGYFFKMLPVLFKLFAHVIRKGWKSLAFVPDLNCDGCGICKQVCPLNNIEIIDNRPSWSLNCAGCFACYHWCPKNAVRPGNLNLNLMQYHHPEISISDMMKQKASIND